MKDLIEFDVIDEHGPQTYSGTYDVFTKDLDRHEVITSGSVRIDATHGSSGSCVPFRRNIAPRRPGRP